MKTSLFALGLLATSVLANVVTFNNTDEFNTAINEHDLVLVKFFAPWCEHSKALKPEYELAAEQLKDVLFGRVDCSKNEALCEKERVEGYPLLKIFRKGVSSDIYSDERTADHIVKYMQRHLLPDVIEFKTQEEIDKFKKEEPLLAIAYLSKDDKENQETWASLSSRLANDFAFGLVTEPSLMERDAPFVALHKRFESQPDYYTKSELNATEIEDFIKVHSVPLLGSVHPELIMDYVDAGRPIVYIFADTKEMRDEMDAIFLPLAKKYRGKFSFAHIDAAMYGSQAEFLLIENTTWPQFAIHDFKTGARYPFEEKFETQTIEDFIERVDQGQVVPGIKSQPLPESNPEDPVKLVVGRNFEETVLDKTKDALIFIYAPWCGHSKALMPVYKELASQMANSSVVIAQMDGSENDVPPSAGFQVTGYPTLKLFKAETNEMIDFEGDRTLEGLTEFINTHTHHEGQPRPKHDEL
ncbi:thioredoxin-like protein [Choanephora cucurbitarum]|nr:thioredoxin-like protein [Choanephora cucurbitarum]